MTSSQFDELAQVYEDSAGMPFRQGLEFPTVLHHLGDIADRSVLDFGCGSGVYTRLLARGGARHVVGLDTSAGMIEHCRAREETEGLGVTYETGPLPQRLQGTFDLVLGVYVMPHATTYDELLAMCRTAASALRPGGRWVTLPIHPDVHPDPEYYAPYGIRPAVGERSDGAPVDFQFSVGERHARFTARYWTAPTLERALREAGFTTTDWRAPRLSETAVPGPADDYWAPYLKRPHAAVIDARKD